MAAYRSDLARSRRPAQLLRVRRLLRCAWPRVFELYGDEVGRAHSVAGADPVVRRHRGRHEYGVRGKRGDLEALISEELFYRVQAVLSGRIANTAPRQRAHPDFPLRGFVSCPDCGRFLTGRWSKAS